MANKRGTGLLMVWADMPPGMEDDFNRWYNEEHLAEVCALPGVLGAARYEATRSGPKHLAVYELENPQVMDAAFRDRQDNEWSRRVNPRTHAANFINNTYEMIYPDELTPEMANADFPPALQIGRMTIAPEDTEEWNKWYSGVYVPNYEKVPGCIRGRRWKAYRGSPQYAVMYEFENQNVSETPAWLEQRDINPSNEKMRNTMTHATGSPGIWKKTFQI